MLPSNNNLPRILLLAISLLQGIVLLIIYRCLDAHMWPYEHPLYLYPLLALAIITPTLCLLSFTREYLLHFCKWIGLFSLAIAIVAIYTGWNLEPGKNIPSESIAFAFIVTLGIASFKALMYVQQRGASLPLSYGLLFKLSWRNFLVVSLSGLFMLIFWGILFLCGALFKVVGVRFIADLVVRDWFCFPVLSMALGFGIIIFRSMASVIDTIAALLKVLMKFLLPVLVLVAVVFLGALPFTGLQALWKTGHGSMLILWLQLLILFFTNAVYQGESQEKPYPLPVHRFIYLGIALLPIYSAIACVGLFQRIDQYGFSVERCWGLLIWLLLGMFAAGYSLGIIRKQDAWIASLSRVNISMGLVILTAMLLVNSPLLDFKRISLHSQLRLLEQGKLSIDNLDLRYFHKDLGRPGYLSLQELKQKYADNSLVVARINRVLDGDEFRDKQQSKPSQSDFVAMLNKTPANLVIPEDLAKTLYEEETNSSWSWRHLDVLFLIECDLNEDGIKDYVYINSSGESAWATLWYRQGSGWLHKSMQGSGGLTASKIRQQLGEHPIEMVVPEWKEFKVGDINLSLYNE